MNPENNVNENIDDKNLQTENTVENIEPQRDEKASEPVAKEEPLQNSIEEQTADFVSEFAPAPINIPKYNREKEQKKAEKAGQKAKKQVTQKSRKRRAKLKKAIFVARTAGLFILLAAVVTTMVFSLLVKMNTTEHAIETAIRNNNPELFTIGKIKNPDKINLSPSSPRAALADIIRDNSDHVITYDDIAREVKRSNYSHFLATLSHDIIDYYLFGNEYQGVTEENIESLILSASKRIYGLTGRNVGESASKEIAAYIKNSPFFDDLSRQNIVRQTNAEQTQLTSILFSTLTLICLVIAAMLLIVLVIVSCKGIAHKIIGWAIIIGGVLTGVAGYFTTSLFNAHSELLKDVAEVILNTFNHNAIIWSGLTVVIGIVIMLMGKMISDEEDDYDEYEENGYIDEIEQLTTEQ